MGAGTAHIFHFGDFTLDQLRYRLRRGERVLRLERKPMELLFLLLEKRGELVTREELADRLWGTTVFVDIDQGINTAVRKVRIALRDDPDKPRFIETVAGKGYRFAAPVTYNGEISKSRPSAEKALVQPFVQTPAVSARKWTTAQFAATAAKDSEVQKAKQILDDGATAAIPLRYAAVAWKTKSVLIAVLALVVGTTAWWLNRNRVRQSTSHTRPPVIKSLAVLPLKNLSGDPSQEYLADGMTEELTGRLSGIHDLRVISRTSVMRFKDTQFSAPEIAKALDVDALVEGSVIRDGNRIRVHAQLIRATTDEHFWAQEYDRELEDVLALQRDVAQAIAEKVAVTVTGEEHLRLVATRPVAPEVYESYLKGMYGPDDTMADIDKSISYFEDAIHKDPTFAPAYIGLAAAYKSLGTIIVGAPPNETRPKVISAAQKALQLDPNLAGAHILLADTYQAQWQWKGAEDEYKRALELSPNDAYAYRGYSTWLLCQGRIDEALAWQRRGRELDPLGNGGTSIGWILFHAHRYDEAIRELRTVLEVHPDSAWTQWVLSFALISNGQPDEAIPTMEKLVSRSERSPGNVELLATAYARAGNRTEALRLIDELKQRRQKGYIPAGALINPYLGLGEYDQAFFWFEEAYKEQSNILQFLKVHPFFDPVRGDPRFQDLLRRVGLAQ